jgi:hypothetical protein
MFKTDHYIWTCKYVNIRNLSEIPFNPSSSRLWHADSSNNTTDIMEGRCRNMDHAWVVTLPHIYRLKGVSSCSYPIPSCNPLSVIYQQEKIATSWSLENISNMTCHQTQNENLITADLLVY